MNSNLQEYRADLLANGKPNDVKYALQAKGITHRFGRNTVLSGFDMNVPEGSVYALLGRNGAGKSTLMQLALGLLKPNAGTINVLGLDPVRQSIELLTRTGYIPERLALYNWMTINELLRFTAAQYPNWVKSEEEKLVTKFRLDRTKKIKELSRGMLAMLALVIAMSHQPEIVLLDECTSGMDAIFRNEFDRSVIETLSEAKKTVVFASHQIRELEFICDWVGIMHEGKLMVEAPIEQLKDSIKTLVVDADAEPGKLSGEIGRQKSGRQWLITVRNSSMVAMQDIVVRETLDLSLEQIFIALLTWAEAQQ